MHYMQRTAIQGSPTTLARITGAWTRRAESTSDGVHRIAQMTARKWIEEIVTPRLESRPRSSPSKP